MKVKAKLGQVRIFDREFMKEPAVFEDGVASVPEKVGKELISRYPEAFGPARGKSKVKEADNGA